MTFVLPAPAALLAVVHVLLMRANSQVSRVHTGRIVAVVAGLFAGAEVFAAQVAEQPPMRAKTDAATIVVYVGERAIAVMVDGCSVQIQHGPSSGQCSGIGPFLSTFDQNRATSSPTMVV